MTSNELTFRDLTEQKEYSKMLAASSMLPREYVGKPENVFLAVEWGKSLGISPIEIINGGIQVIQGKPTLSAQMMLALARQAGHTVITKEIPGKGAECTVYLKDMPDKPASYTFTLEDAQRMGLTGRDNWKKQPMTMCMWRAVAKAIRFSCPEVLHGISYTTDEQSSIQVVAQQTATPRRSSYGNSKPAEPVEPADVQVESIDIDETTGEVHDNDEEVDE